MYLTLAELKLRLGITGTAQDAELQFLLDDSRGLLVGYGLDYEKKQRSKLVSICDSDYVYLDCPEVVSIDEINGVAYTGVEDTDWIKMEPKNAMVHFCRLNILTDLGCGCKFRIKYTAGYDPIPSNLKLLQFYLVLALQLENKAMKSSFSSGTGGGGCDGTVKKIAMGPRTVEYVDTSNATGNASAGGMYSNLDKKIRDLINLYKLHIIC